MSDDRKLDFSKIDADEATKILAHWRMEGLHVYSNRINFLLFTQSIFFMAFATLIIGGNIESKMILYVSVIMCIAGIFTAFIFGYTTKIYYDREFGPIDNKMEEIWDWFRMESKAGHLEHKWYVNRILTIVLPSFFIVVWVFLLLLLCDLHGQSLILQMLVVMLLSLIVLYFVLGAYRWKK
jgi:uncharacterized ion transporter superfamily protein YfcC